MWRQQRQSQSIWKIEFFFLLSQSDDNDACARVPTVCHRQCTLVDTFKSNLDYNVIIITRVLILNNWMQWEKSISSETRAPPFNGRTVYESLALRVVATGLEFSGSIWIIQMAPFSESIAINKRKDFFFFFPHSLTHSLTYYSSIGKRERKREVLFCWRGDLSRFQPDERHTLWSTKYTHTHTHCSQLGYSL